MTDQLPTYFISHGGGPWPWVPQMRSSFVLLERSLREIATDPVIKPKAILMISGHWEEQTAVVMASSNPPMIYDYSGFPPQTYEIVYPAPGSPALARQAVAMLQAAGIPSHLDYTRGYDHGTYAPLEIMYPAADIPVFQISLLNSYDPKSHLEIGQALAGLRQEGVLIIGSGLSYHNLAQIGPMARESSAGFDAWLSESLALPPRERTDHITNWTNAPFARECHPREDHLVPLFVALGAAETEAATRIYHEDDFMGGVSVSSYRFG